MLHFVQVSDLHVSRFRSRGGAAHLRLFLANELNLIAPELVVATGDLTDAKTPSGLTSLQQRDEWLEYYAALLDAGVLRRRDGSFWLDQRGNHDCFNVPSFTDSHNLFKDLSAVKERGYVLKVRKPFGVYSFVAIDACPSIGASKPFNFFGNFETADMDVLASEILAAQRDGHNHTFLMSHYPSSTTMFGHTSDGTSFWSLTKHISLMICGHLHKLAGGLGETMYAYHNDLLELELADLKSHGIYRIVVIDHDLVSFVDLPLYSPKLPLPHKVSIDSIKLDQRAPIVLVTNPKDGRYILPNREPVHLIRSSSDIRVVVWSYQSIERVEALIDGVPVSHGKASYQGIGHPWRSIADQSPYLPLWTIPWIPSQYDDNRVHSLVVSAVDSRGVVGNHSLVFRVDGARIPEMNAGPGGFFISTQFGILDLFVIGYIVVCLAFLLVPKVFVLSSLMLGTYHKWRRDTSQFLISLDTASQAYHALKRFPTLVEYASETWRDLIFTLYATFFRFCELSMYPSLFYPLYLFDLYLLVGPWFIGDFVPSAAAESGRRYGWMMVYGIWFQDRTWVPLLDSWLFAFYGIAYAVLPLEFYLSFCCTSPALLYSRTNSRYYRPIHQRWYSHLVVIVVLAYHLLDSLSMGLFYGPVSALVSPAKTWLTIWASVMLAVWRQGPRGLAAHPYEETAIESMQQDQNQQDSVIQGPTVAVEKASQESEEYPEASDRLLRSRRL